MEHQIKEIKLEMENEHPAGDKAQMSPMPSTDNTTTRKNESKRKIRITINCNL